MKQYTITIPDQEENSFIELLKSISYITSIEESGVFDIPEEQKQVVRDRIAKYADRPESYLTWEELENKIKLD